MKVKNQNWKQFDAFNDFVKAGNIELQNARLIPILKTGDEQALTSIFLSSLKLIKEFRDKVFSDVKMKRSGKIYYFTEDVRNMKKSDPVDLENAVVSWHQEEIDMKLMLSRHLGVVVKSKNEDPIKKIARNIQKLKKDNHLSTSLEIKNAPSNIEIKAEFERRMLQMSVEITPNLGYKTFEGRLNSFNRQLKKMKSDMLNHLTITARVYQSPTPIVETYTDYENFYNEDLKKKDVRRFILTVNQSLGGSFKSKKKFVTLIEEMLKSFYEEIVQNLITYTPKPPTMKKENKKDIESVVEKSLE